MADEKDNKGDAAVAEAPPAAKAAKGKTQPKDKTQPRKLPPYNVVLLDDDDHSYDYVIAMLGRLFGYGVERAYKMAREVDTTGRVIVLTTTKEHAELKRDQIQGFGADPLIARCAGSMKAIIEPAETPGA